MKVNDLPNGYDRDLSVDCELMGKLNAGNGRADDSSEAWERNAWVSVGG